MNALTLNNHQAVTVSTDPGAIETRDALIKKAKLFDSIEDAFDAQLAAGCLRELGTLLAAVETSRTAIKRPVLDLGKRIDSEAHKFIADLVGEQQRISKLLSNFTVAQERERERQLRERDEQLRQSQLAKQREEQAKIQAAQASNVEEKTQAELRAQKSAQEAQALAVVAPVTVEEKPAGTVIVKTPRFEVLDIHALYIHNRSLVRLDVNAVEVNKLIRSGESIPGLKTWLEDTVQVRK